MNGRENDSAGGPRQSNRATSILGLALACIVLGIVLFPVYARYRERRYIRYPSCQSNLRECAIAFHMYCYDYDGYLPSSALVSGTKAWNQADFEKFASEAGALNSAPARKRTWSQVLYGSMKDKDIMFCPYDPAVSPKVGGKVSYWWKLAIDKAWYGERCVKPCRKQSDFAYSADQVFLYERAGFHFGASEGLKNDVRINVAYLDSHVKSVSLVNSSKRWITSPLGSGEPAYFNFDNKKPKTATNPPPPDELADHVDPGRYSDVLP